MSISFFNWISVAFTLNFQRLTDCPNTDLTKSCSIYEYNRLWPRFFSSYFLVLSSQEMLKLLYTNTVNTRVNGSYFSTSHFRLDSAAKLSVRQWCYFPKDSSYKALKCSRRARLLLDCVSRIYVWVLVSIVPLVM